MLLPRGKRVSVHAVGILLCSFGLRAYTANPRGKMFGLVAAGRCCTPTAQTGRGKKHKILTMLRTLSVDSKAGEGIKSAKGKFGKRLKSWNASPPQITQKPPTSITLLRCHMAFHTCCLRSLHNTVVYAPPPCRSTSTIFVMY